MRWGLPKWEDMPLWLKRLVLFVGLPAFCGALVAGAVFDSDTWAIVFLALTGAVLLLCIIYDRSLWLFDRFDPGTAVIVVVLLAAVFGVRLLLLPGPEPKNPLVFGCYANDKAPPIRIDGTGMQVLQPGFPLVGFDMDRGPDIAFTTERPIELQPTPTGYRYSIAEDELRNDVRFIRVAGTRDLYSFALTAEDGADLWYDPAKAATCDGGAKSAPPVAGPTAVEPPG